MASYRVYLMNFGYFKDSEYATIAEAKVAARETGFECLIYDGTAVIGSITGVNKTWICFHSEYHSAK